MSELEDLDFATLVAPPRIWTATGTTYPHRETLRDWAWHWDAAEKCWVNANGVTEDDEQIRRIKALPGVVVTELTRLPTPTPPREEPGDE